MGVVCMCVCSYVCMYICETTLFPAVAKGHQQRLSRAPQCYAVAQTGQKSSDLMIAFGELALP